MTENDLVMPAARSDWMGNEDGRRLAESMTMAVDPLAKCGMSIKESTMKHREILRLIKENDRLQVLVGKTSESNASLYHQNLNKWVQKNSPALQELVDLNNKENDKKSQKEKIATLNKEHHMYLMRVKKLEEA